MFRKLYKTLLVAALLCVTTTPAHSQHYLGVKGGWGLATGRFSPSEYTEWLVGTWSGGVAWKYYSDAKMNIDGFAFRLGALTAELEFMERGYQYRLSRGSDNMYRRRINSLSLPLIWQPNFYFPPNWRIIISAGVGVQYNFSSTEYQVSYKDGVLSSSPYEMKFVRDNPFTYGLVAGAGLNYIFGDGRMEILFEVRYHFGYGDILRNASIYPGNPQRSPIDNLNVNIGFFIRLGKSTLVIDK